MEYSLLFKCVHPSDSVGQYPHEGDIEIFINPEWFKGLVALFDEKQAYYLDNETPEIKTIAIYVPNNWGNSLRNKGGEIDYSQCLQQVEKLVEEGASF